MFIYVIGAQCTGKTTLSEALASAYAERYSSLKCRTLSETARNTLKLHAYTRDDVRAGGDRCLRLQQLIMDSQLERESQALNEAVDIVISDRSGLDPLVYVKMYCGDGPLGQLLTFNTWRDLHLNMQNGVVVLCEPVQTWLFDDGTRLMPLDWSEWRKTHDTFRNLLDEYQIGYVVLPASILSIEDRVEFVLEACMNMGKESLGAEAENCALTVRLQAEHRE